MEILLASVASATTATSRTRIASISGNGAPPLYRGASGEPLDHDLGDLREAVQLGEEPSHLLARHVAPELIQIVDVEGNDVPVGGSRARAEQTRHPVIPPTSYRRELAHRRRVGLQYPALVDLRGNTFLEVYQHDHRRHTRPPSTARWRPRPR